MTSARWRIEAEPVTGRPVYAATARGGTEVWVLPMPGFARAHASLTARYGSRDTRLPDGTQLPDGVAHFLEHRMFQTAEGDVFDLYAARGASANAYTTFDHTCYLFDCTTRFDENLATLLTTLRTLYPDEAGIRRERDIIAQEIAMYADDPSWRGYFNLLAALYREHPVRRDIAGTERTIAGVDAALLERIHAAYYQPSNLVLVAAGAVDPDAVLAQADALLSGPRTGTRNRRKPVREPAAVARPRKRARLPVDRAAVWLGMKEPAPGGGRRRIERQVGSILALELLCGDGGRVQRVLYEEGWIDAGFHGSYEDDADYAFASIFADVDAPTAYVRRLEAALEDAAATPFTGDDVERARRKLLGRHLRRLNAPGQAADWLLDVALDGNPLHAGIEALRRVTPRALTARMRRVLGAPRCWSIVEPKAR